MSTRSCIFVLVLISVMILCIFPVESANASEDSWSQKASLNVARGGLGVAAVDGKIYAIGGSIRSGLYPPDITGGFVGTNEEYDPATDTWNFKKSMPTPRDSFAIVSYQNKIYCIGGAVGVNVDSSTHFSSYITSGVNEVYDLTTDTWENKTPLPKAEMNLQANVVNGKIYVIGVSNTYVYDPATDLWTQKTPIPEISPMSSGSYTVSVVFNKSIFVIGEFSTGVSSSELKAFIYNTETDNWSQGKSGSSVVINGAAGATTGVNALIRIYVLGVTRGSTPMPVNQVYNPQTNTWATGNSMPTNRMAYNVAVVSDILYAIGGYNFSSPYSGYVTPTAVNEQYSPIGYGTPDTSYQVPTPTPFPSPIQTSTPTPSQTETPRQSPTPSLTLAPTPTVSPSASSSPSTSDQQPTSSPESLQTSFQTELIYAAAAGGVTAIIIIATAVIALKRKKPANP
jgi:N-acetylneuraminic acid mutarotase